MLVGNLGVRGAVGEQLLQTSVDVTDERRYTHKRSHRKDHDGKEQGIGETDRRQVRRAVVTDHNGVGKTHQRSSELRQHHRKGQLEVAPVIGIICTKRITHYATSAQNYKNNLRYANISAYKFAFYC